MLAGTADKREPAHPGERGPLQTRGHQPPAEEPRPGHSHRKQLDRCKLDLLEELPSKR